MESKQQEVYWDECLEIIKDNVNHQTFNTWFKPIKPIGMKGNTLIIQVPSQFFYEWIEERFIDLLAKTIKRVIGKEAKLEYRIPMDDNTDVHFKSNNNSLPSINHNKSKLGNIRNPFAIPGIIGSTIESQLNKTHTFENFIEGECNRIAKNAGMEIAQKPGATAFNPTVIYGGNGLGKTHVAQAIGNETKRLYPNKAVLYVSTDKFIHQFVESSKNNEINDFINFYQLLDVLILDDVQFLAPAQKTQEAFFAIFNHLHSSGKQLIFTCDRPPVELEGMHERLLSRFKWGLITELQEPEFETRYQILEQMMRNDGIEMRPEVIKYLAFNIHKNIRELRGALITLLAQSSIAKREVDLELAKKVLKNIIKTHTKEINIETIQQMVCDYYDISIENLVSSKRTRNFTVPRQVAMYLSKKFTDNSLKSIGNYFGGRDHTTVIHSCRTIKDLMDTDESFREKVLELQQKVHMSSL